jgi:transcriptional regulator NrdR family protein
MVIIKCPECDSVDLHVYDTKGCIEDGRIIEETECLSCNHFFEVKAELVKIEIE